MYTKLRRVALFLRNPVIRRTLGFLYEGFENDLYYFEAIYSFRKLVYAGLVNIFPLNKESRNVVMILITIVFLGIHIQYQPFDNRSFLLLDRLETATILTVLFTALASAYLSVTNDVGLTLFMAGVPNLCCTLFFFHALVLSPALKRWKRGSEEQS